MVWPFLSYSRCSALFFYSCFKKRSRVLIPKESLSDFVFFYVVLGVILGGRLGYVFFYSPDLLIKFSSQFPFWGVLYVHQGGMSSHGGMIGVVVACLLYSYRHRLSCHHVFDLVVPGAALGFFFGRIANFINGELYGRPASEAWWSVKFPREMMDWVLIQSYEKLQSLAPVVTKLGEVKRLQSHMTFQVSEETWTKWVLEGSSNVPFYIRFIIEEIQAKNAAIIEVIQPFLTPRYPSQLFQSFLEGFLVFVVLNLIWLKPRRPGIIAASFAFLYGIARILGEQYRMPDIDIGYEWLGLTRGQWLSVVLVLGSLVYFCVLLFQKNTERLGGWFPDKKNQKTG